MSLERIQEPEWLLPFEFMRGGDSFFVPTLKPADLIYKIDSASKRAKVKVKIHTTAKDGCLGVRVWRVR